MATRKRTKKQSLAEFRAWLNGVEELQPDDWAPTAEQWQLIRAKIDGIAEPKVVAAPAPAPANQNFNVQPVQGNPYQMASAQAHIPPPPPPSGGIPTGPVEVAPAAAQAAPPMAPVQSIDITSAAKPKDTGDGNYESGFI